MRVFRVDLAVEVAAEDFIGAGLAEELPAKPGRLALLNDHTGDAGVSAGHADQEGKGHASDRYLHSRHYLLIGVRGAGKRDQPPGSFKGRFVTVPSRLVPGLIDLTIHFVMQCHFYE